MSARFPSGTIPDATPGQSWRRFSGWQECEAPGLAMRMELHPGYAVVVLDGELDVASGAAFARELARLTDQGAVHVVADLSRLTFCDAAGIGSLIKARNRLEGNGGWLRLAGPSPQMSRILRLAELNRALPSFAAVADALAGPAGPAGPAAVLGAR